MKWLISSTKTKNFNLEGFFKKEYGSFSVFYKETINEIHPNDNKVIDQEEYFILLTGIIIKPLDFNEQLQTFLSNSNSSSRLSALSDLLVKSWGFFNGFMIDKNSNQAHIFNNHTGDYPVFNYDIFKSGNVLSNDLWLITDLLRNFNISLVPDNHGINQLLKYGYIVKQNTLIKGLNRLRPGQIVSVNENGIQHNFYYKLDFSNKSSDSLDELLNKAYELFTSSTSAILDKVQNQDKSKIYIDISAGLDSRLVNFAINKINPNIDVTNLHYSTSYSDEFKTAVKISEHLKNQFIFSSMNFPNFIREHIETVKLNFGLSNFQSSTNMNLLSMSISTNNFSSILINGQLGDVVLGSYISKRHINNLKVDLEDKAISSVFLDTNISHLDYFNQEDFLFTGRGLNGILSSHTIRSNYSYPISPFLSPDFLKFSLSVPIHYRADHFFYFEFLKKFYPDTLTFWTNRFDVSSFLGKLKFYSYYGVGRIKRVLRNVFRSYKNLNAILNKETMNPFDQWFLQYPNLQLDLIDYVHENFSKMDKGLIDNLEFVNYKNDLESLFNVVTIIDFFKILEEGS